MAATDITTVGAGMSDLKHGLPTGEESGIAVADITLTPEGQEAFRLNYVGNEIGYKLWKLKLGVKISGWLAGTFGTTGLAAATIGAVIASTTNATTGFGITGGLLIVRPGSSLAYNRDDWAKMDLTLTRFPYMTAGS